MTFTHIVAISKNGCIGKNGTLPWHIPEDLKRFRLATTGHAILMGRKTYDSIGKPLPNRMNIVLSRLPRQIDGVTSVTTVEQAMQKVNPNQWGTEIFVIGGSDIFRLIQPDRILLTRVPLHVEGDVFYDESFVKGMQLVHVDSYSTSSGMTLTVEDWRK